MTEDGMGVAGGTMALEAEPATGSGRRDAAAAAAGTQPPVERATP